jgi:hypothetical protein
MIKNFDNEQKLITFLRQNRPLPPPLKDNFEEQLMTIISQQYRFYLPQKNYFFWVAMGIIGGGLLLTISGLTRSNYRPQIANNQEDLETFMINAWQGSMAETLEHNDRNSIENDWLFLTETNYATSESK